MKSMLTRPFVTAACLALAATLSGCGGGDGNTRMDTDTEMTGGTDTDTGQGDLFSMIDLGDWDKLPTSSEGEIPGIENTTHGLKAFYDDRDMPQIVATSPGQPTIAGTWEGNWVARFGANFAGEDNDAQNTMSIDVTIQGGTVAASVTYRDVDALAGGSFTTPAATVDATGRFTSSGT